MLLGSLVKGIHQEQSASNSNRNACVPHGGVEVGEGEGVVGAGGVGTPPVSPAASSHVRVHLHLSQPNLSKLHSK